MSFSFIDESSIKCTQGAIRIKGRMVEGMSYDGSLEFSCASSNDRYTLTRVKGAND